MLSGYLFLDQCGATVAGPVKRPDGGCWAGALLWAVCATDHGARASSSERPRSVVPKGLTALPPGQDRFRPQVHERPPLHASAHGRAGTRKTPGSLADANRKNDA